jgi:hypothetical protein
MAYSLPLSARSELLRHNTFITCDQPTCHTTNDQRGPAKKHCSKKAEAEEHEDKVSAAYVGTEQESTRNKARPGHDNSEKPPHAEGPNEVPEKRCGTYTGQKARETEQLRHRQHHFVPYAAVVPRVDSNASIEPTREAASARMNC